MIATGKPAASEVPAFYQGYVDAAPGGTLLESLAHADTGFGGLTGLVGEAQGGHRYAPGKWSIKEVVQHVIDSERVFTYRALRFARNDTTALPGFDENTYAPASEADRRSMDELLAEAAIVRSATIALYRSFTPEMLARQGSANGNTISVQALGWIIAGHAAHHLRIIHQRYL